MGFQLVIAEGKEAGREFVFDQMSVLIGRTSECDVVLYDPGVSRKHARIFAEGEIHYVEDMGSSNGTKVNGAIVKKKQLSDGDAITLGPVVFNFAGVSLEPEGTDASGTNPGDDPPPEQHTRIVSAGDVLAKRTRNKGEALAPEGAAPDQLKELARSNTRTMQAVKRSSNPQLKNGATGQNQALQRQNGNPPPSMRRQPGEAKAPAGMQLSAAEKARIKRSGGALASLKIFWIEASGPKRIISAGLASLLTVGVFGGLGYYLFKPEGEKVKVVESDELFSNAEPLEPSIGLGEGVDFERPDQKVFDYDLKSPVKMVVVLHYQARDIGDKEVVVTVNGQDVGFVPADTMAVAERINEVIIPPNVLNRNANNKIIFDNVKNPPGKDPWRIWNIGVEAFPLPDLSREELIRDAMNDYARGEKAFESSTIAAENTYRAWRSFRDAWLKLESIEGDKPDQYSIAREKVKSTQVALDRLCSKLLLQAQSEYNQKQFEQARATLQHVNTYFPNKREQVCPLRAEASRDGWQL